MPDYTELSIQEGTTCIAGLAFNSQTGLKSVAIPSSVTGIGPYAFSNTSLESATIPGSITEVGTSAFQNTPWYANQPNGLVYIGKVAYRYKGEMPANTSIEIREGTTAIVDTAFYNCTNLSSISIPNSVTKIRPQAFSGCSSLTNITIPGIPTINERTFENCTSLNEVTLQDGTTVINNYAFYGCSSLTAINWPSTLEKIGNYVFDDCSSLTSIVFPEGLTTLSTSFQRCTNLTSITLPSTLKDIPYLKTINLKELRLNSRKEIPNLMRTFSEAIGFNISSFTYYVPHGLREEYQSHIGWHAGTSNGILEMGDDEDIVRFKDEEVQRICIANYDANLSETVDKTELGEVHYPNLMNYGMGSFYKQAFNGNTKIRKFNEFQYFTNCTEIRWGGLCFSDCSNLISITLPLSIVSIGEQAFRDCSSLTSITIPENVTNIGSRAFEDCTSLKEIYCYAEEVPTTDNNAFYGVNKSEVILVVPDDSYDAYKAHPVWGQFLIETTTGIASPKSSPKGKDLNSIYDLGGRQMVNGKSSNGKLGRGIYIKDGKKVLGK